MERGGARIGAGAGGAALLARAFGEIIQIPVIHRSPSIPKCLIWHRGLLADNLYQEAAI